MHLRILYKYYRRKKTKENYFPQFYFVILYDILNKDKNKCGRMLAV